MPDSTNREILSSCITPQGPKARKNFNYIQTNGFSTKFKMEGTSIDFIYKLKKENCKYIICILIKDDSYFNSKILEKTLLGIKYNLQYLKDILIEPENILICIFFNEIKTDDIFDEEDKPNNYDEYILAQKIYSLDKGKKPHIKVHCISKMGHFHDVEILKCFYCIIVNKLRMKNNIIFTSVITNGISLYSNALKTLIQHSYNLKKNHNIIIPLIEEDISDNIICKIKKYERFHFNLYNMNFYDTTASIPICSLLNTMTIDDNLFNALNYYYKGVNTNMSIDCHDYNLSLFLYRHNISIIYYNIKSMGDIFYSDLEQNPMGDY